jgi:hypothetical protein
VNDGSDMPDDLSASLIRMDAEVSAFNLAASIGSDGRPTPSTLALVQEAFLRFADDGERRQAEASRFLPALIGCLAQIAAQATRELEKRGIEIDWHSN